MSDWGGPYVMMMVVCQSRPGTPMVPVETDQGTLFNLTGIGNRAVISALGESLTADLFIALIPGRFSGKANLILNIVEPNGAKSPPGALPATFDPDASSPTVVKFTLDMTIAQAGTYWFELRTGVRLLSKVPFHVALMPGIPRAFLNAWDDAGT